MLPADYWNFKFRILVRKMSYGSPREFFQVIFYKDSSLYMLTYFYITVCSLWGEIADLSVYRCNSAYNTHLNLISWCFFLLTSRGSNLFYIVKKLFLWPFFISHVKAKSNVYWKVCWSWLQLIFLFFFTGTTNNSDRNMKL